MVVRICPWRMTSVTRERMSALRWSAGRPRCFTRLPCRIMTAPVAPPGSSPSPRASTAAPLRTMLLGATETRTTGRGATRPALPALNAAGRRSVSMLPTVV